MSLTTFSFLIFTIITLIIYFVIPKKFQWIILLASSLFFLFYDNFSWITVLEVLVILLTSYVFSNLMGKNPSKSKLFLILGIVIILGELLYLKYTNFFLITIKHLLSLIHYDFVFESVNRIVPIGISYYSLIMISYLVDVYRGLCEPQKNPLKCALFMFYFPIVTSGPFYRYNDMKEKLYSHHKFNYENFYHGFIRILWGLFKILVISQRLGIYVDQVYANYTLYQGVYIFIAAIYFVIQLYTNFSGSIDVIMGISKIMGIVLPENFQSPFFSLTITELWRRWHITLGAWLKDYVFYPLMKSNIIQKIGTASKKIFGKKVSKKITLYISMFIMWFLIGAWHNGAYTFIIGSGILQFIYMVAEDLLTPVASKVNKKLGIKTDVFSYKLYQCVRTFLLFALAMIFFRSSSVTEAINIIKNMFVLNLSVLFDNWNFINTGTNMLLVFLIVLFIVDYLNISSNVIDRFMNQNLVFKWIIIYLLIFTIIIFGVYGPGYNAVDFIYGGF